MNKNTAILDDLIGWVKQHKIMLVILCCAGVLKEKIKEWILEYVCPITSCVHDDNILAMICILVGVGIIYLIQYSWLKNERENIVSRNWTLFLLFAVYLIFRTDDDFYFNGIRGSVFGYIDYAWIAISIIEFFLFRRRLLKNCDAQSIKTGSQPFLADTPTDDDHMGRGRYAEQLVEKILATPPQSEECGAFSILINEHYGIGKTSFFMQLCQMAERKGIDVCWFKPWLYEDNKSLIVNFFRLMREKLGEGDKPLLKMLSRYAEILSSIEGYRLFSALRIDESSIETQFTDIKKKLWQKCRPIIVLIDDVDRLQSDELLKMLQLIRNTADFPNQYYIIAGDKQAMANRLREKNIAEPEEYLKKFFNLEICFPADDNKVDEVFKEKVYKQLSSYGDAPTIIWDFISQLTYKKEIFANIRDINRYINLLDFSFANLNARGILNEINMRDIAGIIMIQYIDSEFYKLLRDHDEYILRHSQWGTLCVRDDYKDLFINRETKKSFAKLINDAQSGIQEKEISRDKTQNNEDRFALQHLVEQSHPYKNEIIGDILNILFSSTSVSASRLSICYPIEYFKYFAMENREKDVLNTEVIEIMRMSQEAFLAAVKEVISEGRFESFRHKLSWYISSQTYDRLDMLNKVLAVAEADFNTPQWKKRDESVRQIYFMQQYEGKIWNIFKRKNGESLGQSQLEWNKIANWLIHSTDYTHRIDVLQTLRGDMVNESAYIFTKEDIQKCRRDSTEQYVSKVWAKDKYNPSIYINLMSYRAMDDVFTEELILDELLKRKDNRIFLYHLVEKKLRGIEWNQDFIRSVIHYGLVFHSQESRWMQLVPNKWRDEFLHFDMKSKLNEEEIKQSLFLKEAFKWWTKVDSSYRKEG